MSGSCHNGNVLVFDHDGVQVYAGGTNRNGGWTQMRPYPDLALGPIGVIASATTRDVLPKGWSCTEKVGGGELPVVIEIDWPDYNVPKNLGKDFWYALVVDIKSKKIKTVSTQCMGGHGRTGVQLAILVHLLSEEHKWTDAYELIEYVRKVYCDHAVEAKCQQEYIADICNLPVGKSAIVIKQTNTWGIDPHEVIDFDNFKGMTEDELEEQERKDVRANKKKKTQGVQWKKAKPKQHYSSPLVPNWSLTFCPNCQNHEWRRASSTHMERDCLVCFDGGVIPMDEDVHEYKTEHCTASGILFHKCEMYDDSISNLIKAEMLGMSTRQDDEYTWSIKMGNKWVQSFFVVSDGNGGLMSADKLFKEVHAGQIKMEKGHKKSPKQKGLGEYGVQELD
tara:strand:+ start:260 stop:1438 length:1179 start_codon:yes stop_codon:yes gene_type:complete